MFTSGIDWRRAVGRAPWWIGFVVAVAGLSSACGRAKTVGAAVADGAVRTDGTDAPAVDARSESAGDAAAADTARGDALAGDTADASPSAARVIEVTTTATGQEGDGLCSLEEAIAVAGGNASAGAAGDCAEAVAGTRIVQLRAHTYTAAAPLAPAGGVEIHGAGLANTIVRIPEGSPVGSPGSPGLFGPCGVVVDAPDDTVKLTGLTLLPAAGASSATTSLTGACVVAGTLWLRHVHVAGFTGGGLWARGTADVPAKLAVFNSWIEANRNHGDGGGVTFVGGASIYVEQSSIVENTSDGDGGGVFGSGVGLNTIKNSTVSGNYARRGGGVAVEVQDQGYLALYSSTIARNHADEVGGGVYQALASATDTVNTIVNGALIADNDAAGDSAQANLNADWASNFTCTQSLFYLAPLPRQPSNIGGSCLYGVADPRLGPLMNMGGVDGLPVHALLPGSAAIDAIDAAGSGEVAQERDSWNASAGDPQIGPGIDDTPPWTMFGRPADGDGDGVAGEDMGSYEVLPRWEAELLAVGRLFGVDGQTLPIHGVLTDAALSHGAGTELAASAVGAGVSYVVPVPEPGTYDLTVVVRAGPDAGRFALAWGERPDGPYAPLGDEHDGYAAADGATSFATAGLVVAAAGQRYLQFTITGKNQASTGYSVFPDYITLQKQ